MSEQTQIQIKELKTKKAVWQLFADAVELINDEDIIHQGTLFQQIVWVNNNIDFYVDPNALPVGDQLVLPNIELFRNVDYSISNYNLLKGKAEILNQINHKISALNFGIQSLEQNLKN